MTLWAIDDESPEIDTAWSVLCASDPYPDLYTFSAEQEAAFKTVSTPDVVIDPYIVNQWCTDH